ncbi:MAG: DUF3494 domain-containing protein, partial [Chloroflexi bacterium]|nr:DUF3494 domain-containing protein [Chloroflexota bacterium]
MFNLSKWSYGAFVGLVACAVLFASAYPKSGVASSPLLATAPSLGTAGSFAVLAGSGITVAGAINSTTITGDIGTFPTTSITGLGNVVLNGVNHAGDAVTQGAKNDLVTAYNALTTQACDVNLSSQDLGGKTLTAGVYCFDSSAQLTGALTLDAQGVADAVWVFKIGSTLTTASDSSVLVINGGDDCHVFWQVGTSATLGTRTAFKGNILALTSITLNTGASIVSGRALARNGAVTLDTNVISIAGCAAQPPPPTVPPPTVPP